MVYTKAKGCLARMKHPIEGVTKMKGSSDIQQSDDAAIAAFKRIRDTLPHHLTHDGDVKQDAQLDDLAVVHTRNKLKLGNVDIYNIVGPTSNKPWTMGISQLEALVACRDVWELSLTRCVMSKDWLPKLLSAWGGVRIHEGSNPDPRLTLNSCVYGDDTLHLTGHIPKLVIEGEAYPKTVKVTGSTIIRDYAFNGFRMTTVHLSPELKEIKQSAFAECVALRNVNFTLCTGLEKIGVAAFCNCKALVHIKLPPSLTVIMASAFEGCSNLQTVDLSGCIDLKELSKWAFRDCDPKIVMPG